jgi:hypothetical protein
VFLHFRRRSEEQIEWESGDDDAEFLDGDLRAQKQVLPLPDWEAPEVD